MATATSIVGAKATTASQGRAYLYLGERPGGLGATPALTLTGEATGNYFGDVRGDGGGCERGWLRRYHRGRLWLQQPPGAGLPVPGQRPAALSATPALTLTGEAVSDHFGYSVATAGDVNGDGYADVIVGAYGYNSYQGRAYLYLGSPGSLSATAAPDLHRRGGEQLLRLCPWRRRGM